MDVLRYEVWVEVGGGLEAASGVELVGQHRDLARTARLEIKTPESALTGHLVDVDRAERAGLGGLPADELAVHRHRTVGHDRAEVIELTLDLIVARGDDNSLRPSAGRHDDYRRIAMGSDKCV